MGSDKQYDGYTAYDYLDGDDYRQIELASKHSGFEPRTLALSSDEEARVDEVTDETVVSFHEHAFRFPADIEADIDDYVLDGRIHTA